MVRVHDQKVTDSRSRTGNASLCPWERHFTLISLWGPSSLLVVVAQPDKRLANRTKKGCSALVRLAEKECQVYTNERTIAKLHLEHRMRNCIIASQHSCIFRKLVCVGNTRKLSKSESLFTCM